MERDKEQQRRSLAGSKQRPIWSSILFHTAQVPLLPTGHGIVRPSQAIAPSKFSAVDAEGSSSAGFPAGIFLCSIQKCQELNPRPLQARQGLLFTIISLLQTIKICQWCHWYSWTEPCFDVTQLNSIELQEKLERLWHWKAKRAKETKEHWTALGQFGFHAIYFWGRGRGGFCNNQFSYFK